MSGCNGKESSDNTIAGRTKSRLKSCIRCKAAKPSIVVRHVAYCSPCFVHSWRNKFRKQMDIVRTVARDRKVMIAFSGGPSSRSVLHGIKHYLRPNAPVQNFASVEVVFVDDSAVIPGAVDRTDEVRAIVEAEGLPLVAVKLEDVFHRRADGTEAHRTALAAERCSREEGMTMTLTRQSVQTNSEELLRQLFASISRSSSLTAVEDLHRILLRRLLELTARRRGCSTLLLGDTSTNLAASIFDRMGKGRGGQVAVELSNAIQLDDLSVIRPASSMLAKEVAFFNRLEGLQWLPSRAFTTAAAAKASLGRLSESFVVALEREQASTVATIARTGSKLVHDPQGASESPSSPHSDGYKLSSQANIPYWDGCGACPLCGMPSKAGAQDWKANITISSRSAPPPGSETLPETVRDAADDVDLRQQLCYGCTLILTDNNPARRQPGKMVENGESVQQLLLPDFAPASEMPQLFSSLAL